MNFRNLFDYSLRFLLIFLPWSTVISVFLLYKLHIPGANFIKEFVLLISFLSLSALLFQDYKKNKLNPIKFYFIPLFIIIYILVMSFVTIFTTGFRWLVFGGRYDFVFLLVFLISFYGFKYLKKSIFYYLKIFLYSAGLMLIISWFFKFPLSEELLLYLWYSANASMWDFGWAPPIFHGINGAWVRRFQWLLDWPNTMWAFLIIFSWIFFYTFRKYKDWYFFMGLIFLLIVTMLIYTYSRSAVIWLILWFAISLLGWFFLLWKKYKKQIFSIVLIIIFWVWFIFIKYDWNWQSIIGREWSTKWHAERMVVWLKRFVSNPLWQWMWSAWPAYRHVLSLQNEDRKMVEEQDRFYIPESWYIQQFIEWWFLWGVLFLVFMVLIFFSLFGINSILAWMFAWIGVMNLFLHTFESSVVSWLLFLLLGLILSYDNKLKSRKK